MRYFLLVNLLAWMTHATCWSQDNGQYDEQPSDSTETIINETFDEGTGYWNLSWKANSEEATNVGFQGARYENGEVAIDHFAEAWKADWAEPNYLRDGSISRSFEWQEEGQYLLQADIVANNQGYTADESNPEGRPDDVQLFATSERRTHSVQVATANNLPEHFTLNFYHDGGPLTVGLRVEGSDSARMPANWVAIDNVQLILVSRPDSAELAERQEVEATLRKLQHYLAKVMDTRFAEWAEGLTAIVGSLEAAVSDSTATADMAQACYAEFRTTLHSIVTRHIEPGDDLSILIENASFDNDASGWDYPGEEPDFGGQNINESGTMAGTLGDAEEWDEDGAGWHLRSGCAEAYHKPFSMSQTIHNLPFGVYTLTCQAFERNDDGYDYFFSQGPEEGITASLFVQPASSNELSRKLPNILSCATDSALFRANDWYTDTTDSLGYGYMPFSMSGTNYHFHNDIDADGTPDYTVSISCVLNQTDDLTFGLRSEGNNSWVIFDNFRLIYNGYNAAVFDDEIDHLVAEASAIDRNAIGTAEASLIESAIALSADRSTTEQCYEIINQLNAAIAAAKTSRSAYIELNAAFDDLSAAISSANGTSEATVELANNLYDEALVAINRRQLSTDAVRNLCQRIVQAIAQLRVPDTKGASAENPIDFTQTIINNSFETGDYKGWSVPARMPWDTDLCVPNASSDPYTMENADGEHLFNIWAYDPTFHDYFLTQTIQALPAGQYRLSALLASDLGNEITLAANDFSETFTMQHGKERADDCGIDFYLGYGEPLIIRVSSPTWFKADRFRLEYQGLGKSEAIDFADAEVKRICVENWDADGDGELSLREAAVVTSLGTVFSNNDVIVSFDELHHFTNLTAIDDRAFYRCPQLRSVKLPEQIITIGQYAFQNNTSLRTINVPASVSTIEQYAFQYCTALAHIELPDSLAAIGTSAFQHCTAIRHIVVPANVANVGVDAFVDTPSLLAVEWNGPARVSADCFDQPATRGNMLVYVNSPGDDDSLLPDIRYAGNVVRNGHIDQLTLQGGQPLYVPTPFRAGTVSHTRSFKKASIVGQPSGWESMVLPFDVQRITHESKGDITPFGIDSESGLHFWAAEVADGEFVAITQLRANTPVIVSMPNSDRYQEPYNLPGAITFSATDALVSRTEPVEAAFGEHATFVGTYTPVAESPNVYLTNESYYSADGHDFAPGGIFLGQQRDVQPFEAYVYWGQQNGEGEADEGASRPRYIPIFPQFTADDALAIQISTDRSPTPDSAVYDLTGRRVAASMQQFMQLRHHLPHGIYVTRHHKFSY